MTRSYKLFMLFDKECKTFINSCLGYKELYEFLGRSKSSVDGSLSRLRSGKLKHIRHYDGTVYTLITEEDINGKVKKKK